MAVQTRVENVHVSFDRASSALALVALGFCRSETGYRNAPPNEDIPYSTTVLARVSGLKSLIDSSGFHFPAWPELFYAFNQCRAESSGGAGGQR